MKRFISMLVVICLVAAMMPVAFAETVTDTIYSEDFESGEFTLVTNEENTVKELYKDGEATGWTFAKTNGVAFSSFPEEVVVNAATTQTPVNDTMAMTTGTYVLKDTQAYLNLPETYDSGIINVSFRIKREDTKTNIRLRMTADQVTNDAYTGKSAACFVYATRGSSSSPDVYAYNYNLSDTAYNVAQDRTALNFNTSSLRNSVKGYVTVNYIIDLDNNTLSATVHDKELVTDVPLCDSEGKVSALVFDAVASLKPLNGDNCTQGKLGIDDIVITHTYEDEEVIDEPKAEVEGLTINNDGTVSSTATFNYLDTDVAPKTARLVTAFYKEDGQLITVKSDTKTVSAETTSATLTTPAVSLPAETHYIKAFVWDFSTLKPYATIEIPAN